MVWFGSCIQTCACVCICQCQRLTLIFLHAHHYAPNIIIIATSKRTSALVRCPYSQLCESPGQRPAPAPRGMSGSFKWPIYENFAHYVEKGSVGPRDHYTQTMKSNYHLKNVTDLFEFSHEHFNTGNIITHSQYLSTMCNTADEFTNNWPYFYNIIFLWLLDLVVYSCTW